MLRNSLRLFVASALAGALFTGEVAAQETIKVGLVMPLTGVLGPVGKQAVAGARLYLAQHGNMVAGRISAAQGTGDPGTRGESAASDAR